MLPHDGVTVLGMLTVDDTVPVGVIHIVADTGVGIDVKGRTSPTTLVEVEDEIEGGFERVGVVFVFTLGVTATLVITGKERINEVESRADAFVEVVLIEDLESRSGVEDVPLGDFHVFSFTTAHVTEHVVRSHTKGDEVPGIGAILMQTTLTSGERSHGKEDSQCQKEKFLHLSRIIIAMQR